MSYERMKHEEKRLRQEIRALTTRASKRDAAEDAQFGPDFRGDELPQELKRREERLAKIQAAKQRLEARKREETAARERDRDDEDPPKHGREAQAETRSPEVQAAQAHRRAAVRLDEARGGASGSSACADNARSPVSSI